MKMKITIGIIGIILLLVSLNACGVIVASSTSSNGTGNTPSIGPVTTTPAIPDPTIDPETPVAITEEEAQQMAHDFVVNSPTFAFDGMEDTLELVNTETFKCPGCWDFTFEFDSSQAGYGDRTNMMLAQVITHHQAVISVRNYVITEAVLDNSWNMQVQMMIASEQESLELAREYLENSPTFAFDGIEGSIVHVETLQTLGFYTWGFVFEFQCSSAGYGDRTDQETATVVTDHTAVITVEAGEITSGLIDGKWDMVSQLYETQPSVATATATAP